MEGPQLKANEKLPRGSFFYIQVGHRFYAGEEAETREVEVDPTQATTLTRYGKNGKRTNEADRNERAYYWWASRGHGARGPRAARDARKGTTPTYALPRKRPEKVIRKEMTGKLNPKLVDEMQSAKKYRRQDLVQNACERLKGVYSGLDVKISVKFEQGENQ